jgi:8-oxo-dGTP diphosphatase
MAFDHYQILTDASNRLRRDLEFSGLATRFLPDYFTLGQIQDVYETIWEVELDPANFRDKLTNVDGWIREVKNPPQRFRRQEEESLQHGIKSMIFHTLNV